MGFIFDNKHSGDMGVVFKSTDRTLLPAKRVTQYTIPGKSGTYDIEDGYENREIVCTVAFVGETTIAEIPDSSDLAGLSLEEQAKIICEAGVPDTERK